MKLLAIDPGTYESAFVIFDCEPDLPTLFGKWDNAVLLREIHVGERFATGYCAIEMIGHYGTGMPAGGEVFDTCVWIGRFFEAWWQRQGGEKFGLNQPELIKRATVKAHLCRSAKAKDGNVRQAVIDRYGGEARGIGGTKCGTCKGQGWRGRSHDQCGPCEGSGWQYPPGPLYEVTKDVWQALGLAVTWKETIYEATPLPTARAATTTERLS